MRTIVDRMTISMGSSSGAVSQGPQLVDARDWEAIFIETELLPKEGGIQGNVIDADTGDPIQGVTVQSGDYQGTTDSEGWYEIGDIPAGEYRFSYSAPGYHVTERDATIVAEEWTRLDVLLYDETGLPPPPPDEFEFPWLWVGLGAAVVAAIATYRKLKKD